ncbi:hypothetical protein FRX31_019739 [Thalictrum thalictroides]|uniref:KIB1-4 beta-propeller domain-containing protein n=1 Tax=Thalictrum thalictroides TaxID=46969 RepID=A0A7J6W1N6_THATH|nr:hypothetical protein FRX31_019739 [Thalictrum thalictroides]
MIILGAKLAFFMPSGDKAYWTYLETNFDIFQDTLYYRDQFYFVDESGTLFACDLNHPHNPRVSPVLVSPPYSTFGLDFEEDKDNYLYLVELSSGDLLLAKRVRKYTEDYERSYTIGFSAYKMNPLVDLKWIKVHNLCGDTVFVGASYSSSLRA